MISVDCLILMLLKLGTLTANRILQETLTQDLDPLPL